MSAFTDAEDAYFMQVMRELSGNREVSFFFILPRNKQKNEVWNV